MSSELLDRIGDVLAWQPGDPVHDRDAQREGGNHSATRRLLESLPDHSPNCRCEVVGHALWAAEFRWHPSLAAGVDPCSARVVGVPECEPDLRPDTVNVDPGGWVLIDETQYWVGAFAPAMRAAADDFEDQIRQIAAMTAVPTIMFTDVVVEDEPEVPEHPRDRALRFRRERNTGPDDLWRFDRRGRR